jgi:hypothetical protein
VMGGQVAASSAEGGWRRCALGLGSRTISGGHGAYNFRPWGPNVRHDHSTRVSLFLIWEMRVI